MSTSDYWQKVAEATRNLPDHKLLDVVALIDRLPDEGRPLHVLEAMRGRLTRLRPPRRLTIQRLLFLPVEDLFDPPDAYRRKIGRLSRAVIRVCWRTLVERGDAALIESTARRLKGLETHEPAELMPVAAPLWRSAAATLADAHAIAERDRMAGVKMFGRDDDLLRQVGDIAIIFGIGEPIMTAKFELPAKPIQSISAGQAEMLTRMIAQLGSSQLVLAKTFVLVLAARMARPGDLLEVLDSARFPCQVTERDTMVREVEASIIANLVREAQALRSTAKAPADPVAATETARRLVEGLTSLRSSMKSLSEPATMAHIQSARREIAGYIMGNVIDRAERTMASLIGADAGSAGSSIETLSEPQLEATEALALSLRHCAGMGEAVGIQREVAAKLRVVCDSLARSIDALNLTPEAQERRLYGTLRLIEMIEGPEAAEALWLKGLERLGFGPAM
ncbi:MAG: hypothetical protein GC191_16540 [Azospirillum sp.]|nr:hypothetical protein [Azospirillum sp.]